MVTKDWASIILPMDEAAHMPVKRRGNTLKSGLFLDFMNVISPSYSLNYVKAVGTSITSKRPNNELKVHE